MNRVIKFRGLTDTEAPTWVYGSLVNNFSVYSEHSKYPTGTPVCEIIVPNGADCWEDIESYEGVVTVIPDSVGDFTGLLDKNGTEIYEGDIVKQMFVNYSYDDIDNPMEKKFAEKISVIEYRHHGFWVMAEDFGWEGENLWDWDAMEVIGNIHQHQHLLNQQSL